MSRRRAMMPSGRLPSGYQEVEWIASDGYSWLALPPTFPSRTTFQFAIMDTSDTSNQAAFFGSLNPNWGNISIVTDGTFSRGGSLDLITPQSGAEAPKNTKISIKASNRAEMSNMLYGRYRTDRYPFVGRMYALTATSTVLLLYLVPCYRKSDNIIGMYDLVDGVFYTNAGTGTFTKGADVN